MRYPSSQTVVQVPSMLAFEDDYYAIGSVTLAMGFPRNVRAGTIPSHSRLNTAIEIPRSRDGFHIMIVAFVLSPSVSCQLYGGLGKTPSSM